jgi:polar amino acid transport system substrate-binding protein
VNLPYLMKNVIGFLSITLFLIVSRSAIYAEPVKVGIFNIAPYYEIQPNGEVKGTLYEILTQCFQDAKIEFTVLDVPPKRLYYWLSVGEIDFWFGVKVAEYQNSVFQSKPLIKNELRVYTMGNNPLPATKEQLKGKHIVTIFGWTYGGVASYLADPENNITTYQVSTVPKLFRMLKAGHTKYALMLNLPADKFLKQNHIPKVSYSVISNPDFYFSVSKRTPDASNLLKRLEKSFNKLNQAGKF